MKRQLHIFILLSGLLLTALCQANVTLEEKIGQMIMVGFNNNTNFEDTVLYDIQHRNLGSVILMGRNIDSPSQIRQLCNDLQIRATTPLMIATDQEGGLVARLDENNGYEVTQRAYTLGTVIDSEDSTRAEARKMAQWLAHAGINTNLAPCVDVNVNPASPAIGYYGRSFSSDPYRVFDHAQWFAEEFQDEGIVCALKHFPGHGSAMGDSHDGFTDISTTWSEEELIPYHYFMLAGYEDMIMMGHLFNSYLDPAYPASLSHYCINDLLRDSLGFEGAIISDGMFMRALTDNYTFEQAVVLAINAGTDILLYTTDEYNDRSLTAHVIQTVMDSISNGIIPESRIHESYERIMDLKERVNTGILSPPQDIAQNFKFSVYPNPFNMSTTLSLNLSEDVSGSAQISIFSLDGRRVTDFNLTLSGQGTYSIPWNGIDFHGNPLPSGTYIYTVDCGQTILSGRMTLLK